MKHAFILRDELSHQTLWRRAVATGVYWRYPGQVAIVIGDQVERFNNGVRDDCSGQAFA